MPELKAYQEFLQSKGHAVALYRDSAGVPHNAEVVWWMCGHVLSVIQHRLPNAFHVHEYASASTPPMARAKDTLKRWTQAQPDHRVFQSPWVRSRMAFTDNCPYDYRDMGIDALFFDAVGKPKATEFDFVYLGEMHRLNRFIHTLEALETTGRTLLLVGEVPATLAKRLRYFRNIHYAGRVEHTRVPAQLRRASVGLNLVPDLAPYRHQTSTKLLEYCAVGLSVASTDYAWARHFAERTGASFYWLPQETDTGQWTNAFGATLDNHHFVTPCVGSLMWDRQIGEMAVWRRFLQLP